MNVYVGNRLPSTYQEVEYIQSSGTQYIDTGYIPSNNTKLVMSMGGWLPSVGDYGDVFGARYSWSSDASVGRGFQLSYRKSVGSYQNMFGRNYEPSGLGFSDGNNHIIDISQNGLYIDATLKQSYSTVTFTSPVTLKIFAMDTNGVTDGFTLYKLYSLKIYEIGTLVRDFIPCYRKSDSVIGLYDLVNNQFYTNSGSGTFSKGSDVALCELKNAYIGEVWTPGANTVAYYPLTSSSTIQDKSGNNKTLTNVGNVAFGTYAGVNCAYFNGTSNSQLYNTSISFSAYPTQTVLVWIYITGTSTSVYQTIYHIGTTAKTGKLGSWFKYGTGLCIGSWYGGYESIKSGNINGRWHLLVNVTNGTSSTQYLDGVLYQSLTNSLSGTQTGLYIGGAQQSSSERLSGYESEFIIESKVRTAQEILSYYNNTKSNYGL